MEEYPTQVRHVRNKLNATNAALLLYSSDNCTIWWSFFFFKISHWRHFLFPNQGWPTQRWSGAWTSCTGCRVRTAAPMNSMTLWVCAGGRGLRTGPRLNFSRTFSKTSSSPRRDNMRCSRDKRKGFLLINRRQQNVLKTDVRLERIEDEDQPNVFFNY